MADYGINSTQLSDPQGQGTGAVAPVQEHASGLGMSPVFAGVADIFAKGLVQNRQEEIAKRKAAVVGEYINNENVYGDAMVQGSWNASQVSTASRANFSKFIASFPEYAQDIHQARAMVYGGTEVGEAQKKVDAEKKQEETDIAGASSKGYIFYSGMSDTAKASTVEAYKAGLRMETQFKQDTERAAESRAQRADVRAGESHQISVDDHVAKENASNGAREVAAKNFDVIATAGDDLIKKLAAGTIAPEQALAAHKANVSRINAALNAISGKNPEMAAPWIKLFGDIDQNISDRLDPTKKSANDLKLLKDKYDTAIVTGKLLAVEKNPKMLKAVVASNLFQGEGMVTLANAPVVRDWLMSASGNDPSLPAPQQVVGTQDDAALFKNTKTAIAKIASMPTEQKELATREATNVVNTMLAQTTQVDGRMNPGALKEASKFYASTEFGKLALEGKIDKQTASNAQHIFQVQYEPAVRSAILQRLDTEVYNGEPLSHSVGIKAVGGEVRFERKPSKAPTDGSLIDGWIGRGMRGNDITAGTAAVKEAEAGLNQLIRMHAHLEGTTDYGKYWEAHKHELMPSIFPDPAKLKPGQVVDGHKYIGGNYRDPSNWTAEPVSK